MSSAVQTSAPSTWSLLQLLTLLNAPETPPISSVAIPTLIETAHQQHVAPYLHWKLDTLGVELDAPEWQPLTASYQRQTHHYLEKKHAAQQVNAALSHANIPALWLKGFALAHSVYPNPVLRPMLDLDVLVPFAERARALECLLDTGYAQAFEMHTRTVQDLWHHYRLHGEALVELHYALLGMHTKLLPPPQLAWFWQHTQSIQHHDLQFNAFSPEAEFLHLCAHALLFHSEHDFHLQRALDLHLLLTKNPGLDWDLVLERANELGWLAAVTRAVEITRTYFDTPIPPDAFNALYAPLTPTQIRHEQVHASNDATRSEKTWALLHQMDRTRQWHWVIGSLLPRPKFMRWRYNVRADWQLPFFYLRRWFEIGRDVLQTLFKRVRAKISTR